MLSLPTASEVYTHPSPWDSLLQPGLLSSPPNSQSNQQGLLFLSAKWKEVEPTL
jgi:hypothetical protein